MKNLVLILSLFLITSNLAFSQKKSKEERQAELDARKQESNNQSSIEIDTKTAYQNFKLQDNRKLVWRKIYQTKLDSNEFEKTLKMIPFLSNLEKDENLFYGRSGKSKLSNTKDAPIAALQSFDVFVNIEYKNYRYRVTITDVVFDETSLNVYGGGIGIGQSQTYTLEDMVVRNNYNEIRKNRSTRRFLEGIDSDFEDLFKIKITSSEKDDW